MRSARSALASGNRSLVVAIGVCLLSLSPVGCSSPPFQANSETRSGAAGTEDAAANDSGWPGDLKSDDGKGRALYHQVDAGETLSDIASIYDLPVSRLRQANSGLDESARLKPGQLIHIPRP